MSRTRYTHRAHQMRSMPAAYPLVVRRGMRPVGYGYGYGYGVDMPAGGWPCLYSGVSGQADAVKQAAEYIKASAWYGTASASDKAAVDAAATDGSYTSAFKTAVTNMQRDGKYNYVDGVIGPETWGKIGPAGSNKGANCPAPASSSSYVPSGGGTGTGKGRKPASNEGADGRGGGSITDKAWFWPVAILVPTAAVIGGILFWPKKKAQ